MAAVQWDREKSSNRVKQQDELLREYLQHHLYPYSPFYRRRFDAAGIAPKNIGSVGELAKLEPTTWREVVAEPGAFVLRPTERAIARFGDRRLVMAIARAKLRGRVPQLNRDLIDPSFKPVHWILAGDVPVGYSSEDLERLGEAGRRFLQVAGVGREDVIAGLVPPGPNLSYWQVVDGARHAGVAAVHLEPGASLRRLEAFAPTVLAGTGDGLEQVLETIGSSRGRLPGLRTLLVVGGPLTDDAERDTLRRLGRSAGEEDLEVVAAWAPPGVRTLWAECRGGRELHTYPDFEWLEVLPEGEVAWTSLVWHGTTFLRLATGVRGVIDDSPCSHCGRVGPRLRVTSPPARLGAPPPLRAPVVTTVPDEDVEEDFVELEDAELTASEPAASEPDELEPVGANLRILDEHPGVAAWQAEYRRVDGHVELIVFVAPAGVDRLGPLFRELDATLQATQYVVMRPEQISERVVRAGAVVDLR